ncbi:MAG: hypothetical protein U0838_12990 [Chloroflexota bacterium]
MPDTGGYMVPAGQFGAAPAAAAGGMTVNVSFHTLLSPSRAQIAELADHIDREPRSRYPQFSPTPARG